MAKTIAAIATGNCMAGIGVIRISGDKAIEIASKVFCAADNSPLDSLKGYTAKYGHTISNGETFDDAVALVFRGPKSYTGEDVVELSLHGGIALVEKGLKAIFDAGAVPAQPGEFTKKAFLNGKIDLTQAESIATLISSQGEAAAKASYNALQGNLSNKINAVLEKLLDCSALISAWVDYPDEEIPELGDEELQNTLEVAKSDLKNLLDGYSDGQIITNGIDTVIVGKPNVGKSSLMNMLSGNERSIVTEVCGTTRDVVENTVRLGDIVLRLADTAGIRKSDDLVENIGIKMAQSRLTSAQLALAVFDVSRPVEKDDIDIAKSCDGKCAVAIFNKSDLDVNKDFNREQIEKHFALCVNVSAKNEIGLKELENTIKNLMGVKDFNAANPILANERQRLCCKNAYDYVLEAISAAKAGMTFDAIGVMIDSACDELLGLTGKKATQEVVNNIFSKFCVGK